MAFGDKYYIGSPVFSPALQREAVENPAPGRRARPEVFARGVYGSGFRVGRVHFKVGYQSRAGHRPYSYGRYRPAYYFYVRQPVVYRGYSCSRFCFRRGRNHYYHHPGCPVLDHYFRRYGHHPSRLLQRYGPQY